MCGTPWLFPVHRHAKYQQRETKNNQQGLVFQVTKNVQGARATYKNVILSPPPDRTCQNVILRHPVSRFSHCSTWSPWWSTWQNWNPYNMIRICQTASKENLWIVRNCLGRGDKTIATELYLSCLVLNNFTALVDKFWLIVTSILQL